jgi:hypothetical protein
VFYDYDDRAAYLIFSELITNTENLNVSNAAFVKEITLLFETITFRLFNPILWPDWIFRHTKYFKRNFKYRTSVHSLADKVSC